jgi:acetyl-CoA carboxylase, biotin carboxylase subunit
MPAPPFKRVLIANRGEIAVRVIRACEKLGIESVAAVSDADRESLAARIATRAVCIGPAAARESYLRPELLVTAALGTGCAAIHPGYGFLSERAAFSRMCAKEGVTFIGPAPEAIEAMGDKLSAVQLAQEAGVPRVPGSGRIQSAGDARDFARRHGFPILIKASAGGGGRGMRVVARDADIDRELAAAAAEAQAAFGDPSLYIEKFIERARHIEIQVLGDSRGSVVHLGERDCSTQRRHQKLIEEAPSPAIDANLRSQLADAAVRLARRVHYQGAGTVEFVFDEDTRQWYFLEMNTRIQVEHPVTEMVTGRDLVAEQICIAAGAPISFAQDDVRLEGHAIECRINAEDATHNFAPGPGRLQTWSPPAGPGIRVDTHCFPGYLVPPYYDSLLAKVISHGADRAQAIAQMSAALERFEVTGVPTTIPFHRQVLQHDDFRNGRVTTRWVEEKFLDRAKKADLPRQAANTDQGERLQDQAAGKAVA